MKTLREFVADLSFQDSAQCLKDFEEFEKQGYIGECKLRATARAYMDSVKTSDHIVMWMNQVAFECSLRDLKAYQDAYGSLV